MKKNLLRYIFLMVLPLQYSLIKWQYMTSAGAVGGAEIMDIGGAGSEKTEQFRLCNTCDPLPPPL